MSHLMLQNYPMASVCHWPAAPTMVYIKQKVGECTPSVMSAIATQTQLS